MVLKPPFGGLGTECWRRDAVGVGAEFRRRSSAESGLAAWDELRNIFW
jgi:hypothetical protein